MIIQELLRPKNEIEEMRLELSKSNALREKAQEKLLKQRT